MMNSWKFLFYGVHSNANLRQTMSAIDMVDGALYKLGLGLLKSIVDGMCNMLIFHRDAIEMSKGTGFLIFRKFFAHFNCVYENFQHAAYIIDYIF